MLRSVLKPEADLLILLAREVQSDLTLAKANEAMRLCSDPSVFYHLSLAHGLYPLVAQSLAQLDASSNPLFLKHVVPSLSELCRRYDIGLGRRVRRTVATARKLMTQAALPFCFIKGHPLAARYYLDPSCRICSDADMLIPPSTVKDTLSLLTGAGFRLIDTVSLQTALSSYVGQAEFRHSRTRGFLDVNWSLMGNASIGHVPTDIDGIWRRSKTLGTTESSLAPEDEILNVVRHAGHGHDFEHGFIRSCVDVAAILRTCNGNIDGLQIVGEARASECLRILRFYSYFFDNYYRDNSMVVLTDLLPGIEASASESECACFARFIQAPLVRRKLKAVTTSQFINGNLCFCGKLWALDHLSRLIKILVTIPWPSSAEVALLTRGSRIESAFWRRLRYYFNPLLPGLPGACLGAAARIVFQCLRAFRR